MKKFLLIGSFVLFSISNLSLAQSIDASEQDGRKCYSCTGTDCSTPTLYSYETDCKNGTDQCVSIFHEMGGTIFRGCSQEIPDDQKEKCNNESSGLCIKCSEDLCNKLGPTKAECVICSSEDNSDCLQSPDTLQSNPCNKSESMNTYCYVKYSEKITLRGCAITNDFQEQCRANPESCLMCSQTNDSPICNSIVFPKNRTKCYSCKDGNCTSPLKKEYCALADDSCISLYVNGKQIKKCVTSMTNDEKEYCELNKEQCVKCEGNDCNSENAPENNGTTALPPANTTTNSPGNNTTLAPSNNTTLAPGNNTTLPPGNNTTLPPLNITTLPPGNNTTLSPENSTTTTENPNSAGSMTTGYVSLITFVLLYSFLS